MNNRYKIKRRSKMTIVTIFILTISLFLTVGYSAFSDQFTITDAVAHVRVYKVVRINGVSTDSGSVSNLDYNVSSILNTVNIPAGESITYSVMVTNLGNVPVAVSSVSFSNGNGSISGLTSNISSSNYVKICDNNECTNGVSKVVDVTITNTGTTPIVGDLDVNLTFSELYKVYYEGNEIGEVLEGSTFNYEFSNNPPAKLSKTSGTCDTFNYSNNILNVTNVQSDLYFTESHTINYNGSILGYTIDMGTYTYTFASEWPATVVKDSGTCDSVTYDFPSHTITISNVQSDISLTGTIGNVSITNISYVSSKNVANHSTPTYNGMDVGFQVTFRKEEGSTVEGFEIVYNVSITNTHYNDYIFRGFDFHPTIQASADSDTATLTLTPTGIENGYVIASGETKTFQVTLTLNTNNDTGSYDTSSSTEIDTTPDTEEETGEITASITPSTGDLRSPNTSSSFTVTVNNTYPNDREFTLISSNSNLIITDSSGNDLGTLTVHASRTETYTVYVREAPGATFINNTSSMTMYLSTPGLANITVGNLTFDVDVYNVPDTTKVTVGNVQIAMHRDAEGAAPTIGQIDVTWDRIDYGGTAVSDYIVLLYNASNTSNPILTGHTNSGTRTYSFSDVTDGTYYVIIYGIDEAGNTGSGFVSSPSTTSGYAVITESIEFEWRFDVSVNTSSNLSANNIGSDVALLEREHTVTLTASGTDSNNNNYYLDSTIKITLDDGNVLTEGTDYTYKRTNNNHTGTVVINRVTGNITIEASLTTSGGGCLVKGTKVLLADGKYKNVEDINYDDLLVTYNYETGKFVFEYPIWIEKPKETNSYQEITFSDGTILKTYGYHGIFETELNRFVSVDNEEEFHVGSMAAKKKDNGFEEVRVTKIETKYEKTTYYQVVSTRYFNIITNDLLTVDGTVALSNLYGFNDDITWIKENRDNALLDVYSYDELKDALPYFMFRGMRAEEGKALIKYGIDLEEYKKFINIVTNKDSMWLSPIKNSGKNMWMVTTSLDNVNNFNKKEFLKEEGSIYKLPKVNMKNFVGWLNYADNKMYKEEDKITIYHGMHFEAIFK